MAHIAIAELVLAQANLDSLTFVVSRRALAKEDADSRDRPRFTDRIDVLKQTLAPHAGLDLLVTDHQLIVDIAHGFDVVVLGADKWHQIRDPKFYGDDVDARDQAMIRLPDVALLPRPPHDTPQERPAGVSVIELPTDLAKLLETTSSTEARAGNIELMAPKAREFDEQTGAWTDPDRYERYLAEVANES